MDYQTMPIEKDLEELFKLTNTSKIKDLSKVLDVSPSTITTWRHRGKVPKSAFRAARQPSQSIPPDHTVLPFYEVTASAGDGFLVEKENQTNSVSFRPDWLRNEIGVNPADVFLMLASGDSMYPTIKDGAMIMVSRNLESFSDGVYVMRHEHNLLVKRLQMLPTSIIKVKSDNPIYEPWEINKKHLNGTDLEVIGRVVWTGQRM